MTDLITAAQMGSPEALTALWGQTKRLAFHIADQYRTAAAACCGVDDEDLEQCAALGVLEALRSYEPDKGAFTSWLGFYVRNACRDCLGLKGRDRREHYAAVRLDAPIGAGVEDLTIGDTIHDEGAALAFEQAEHAHDNAILRRDLDAALDRLPALWREAIRKHDLEGHPLHPDEVQPRRNGLNRLRRDPKLAAYRPNYYRHKGLSAFRVTWSSVVEDEVIRKLDGRS